MASYTKGQRRQMAEIHQKIVEAHRRGACDGDGNSVRNNAGAYIPKPRNYRPTARWVKGVGWVEV